MSNAVYYDELIGVFLLLDIVQKIEGGAGNGKMYVLRQRCNIR